MTKVIFERRLILDRKTDDLPEFDSWETYQEKNVWFYPWAWLITRDFMSYTMDETVDGMVYIKRARLA